MIQTSSILPQKCSIIFRYLQKFSGNVWKWLSGLRTTFGESSKISESVWKIFGKIVKYNTWLLEHVDMEFLLCLTWYLTSELCSLVWAIKLNTRREIPYLWAPLYMYYSLLNAWVLSWLITIMLWSGRCLENKGNFLITEFITPMQITSLFNSCLSFTIEILWRYSLCQVQHNLFQSCAAPSSRLLDDKGSTDHHELLYYAAHDQEDEGLSHSSIKVHLLAEECVTTKSHNFRPRFYEIRPVLPGDNLDKEVCLWQNRSHPVCSFPDYQLDCMYCVVTNNPFQGYCFLLAA